MPTKTPRAQVPEPADPPLEELFAPERRHELEQRASLELVELRDEISRCQASARRRVGELDRRDLACLTSADLAAHVRQKAEAQAALNRAEDQRSALDRALTKVRRREADEAGQRAAAAAPADVQRNLLAAEQADAAFKSAQAALIQCVQRLFDPLVRRHLSADPTIGLRSRILRLTPGQHLYQLADLEREGRQLGPPAQRWPDLVVEPGGARFDHLDRLRHADDFAEWQRSAHYRIPAGSQADRQLAELRARFRQ